MTWAFDVDEKVQGVRVQNSKFSTFYRGIQLGEGTVSDGGPVGFSIVQNLFDSIAFNGIIFGDVENNVSGFNMFLDVGTNFNGGDQTPVSSVIDIQQNNNCSIGDMFERSESNNLTYPRIDINDKKAFVVDKGERYQIGIYTRKAGQAVAVSPNGTDTPITTIPTTETEACTINYTFKQTGQRAAVRHGTFRFVAAEDPGDSTGSLMYDEDYIENQNTSGLVLFAEQTGNVVTFGYNSSSSGGLFGEITYSINHLR
jgi:hypothetical protein